jgi:hypothetical protein
MIKKNQEKMKNDEEYRKQRLKGVKEEDWQRRKTKNGNTIDFNYRNYLIKQNNEKLKNNVQYKQLRMVSSGQMGADEMGFDVNDNPSYNSLGPEEDLKEALKIYINKPNLIEKIVNDSRLDLKMKTILNDNFDSSVVPKFNAIRKKNLSVDQIVKLLVQTANELYSKTANLEIERGIKQLTAINQTQIKRYEQSMVDEQDIETLREALIEDNEKQLEENKEENGDPDPMGIDYCDNFNDVEDIKAIIWKLMNIDKCYNNFIKAGAVSRLGQRKLYDKAMTNETLIATWNFIKDGLSISSLIKFYQRYYTQITTYTNIGIGAIRATYKERFGDIMPAVVEEPVVADNVNEPEPEEPEEPAPIEPEIDGMKGDINYKKSDYEKTLINSTYKPILDEALTGGHPTFKFKTGSDTKASFIDKHGDLDGLTWTDLDPIETRLQHAFNIVKLSKPIINLLLILNRHIDYIKKVFPNQPTRTLETPTSTLVTTFFIKRYKSVRTHTIPIFYTGVELIDRLREAGLPSYLFAPIEEAILKLTEDYKGLEQFYNEDIEYNKREDEYDAELLKVAISNLRNGYDAPLKNKIAVPDPEGIEERAAIKEKFDETEDYRRYWAEKYKEIDDADKPNRERREAELKIEIARLEAEKDEASRRELDARRVTTGSGIGKRIPRLSNHHFLLYQNKYYIDLKKLDLDILEIRYATNKHLTIKPIIISNDMKDIINDLIKDRDVSAKQVQGLSAKEQHLLKTVSFYFGLNVDNITNKANDIKEKWEIVRGELMAGNDNAQLKKQARDLLLYFVDLNIISRHDYARNINNLGL